MFLYRALSDRIRDRNPTTTHRTPFCLSLILFRKQALYMTTPELLAIRWEGVSTGNNESREWGGNLRATAQQPPYRRGQ